MSAGAARLVLALALLAAPVRAEELHLELEIDTPKAGAVVGDPGGMGFIAGRAMAHFGEFQPFDIVFVVDVSESTSAPSGADIDHDGVIGQRRGGRFFGVFGQILQLASTDREDSILAAEVAAVETLLNQLDPRTTRVGVVSFGGDSSPFTADAETRVPLTSSYERVRRGLAEIMDEGPNGRTNMESGVLFATNELLGVQNAYSERREGARRIMIFLTDGTPTLPYEGRPNQNARSAIHRAKEAASHGIRIDTYAIGPLAINEPIVTVEMAHVTQGVFTPVRHPEDLAAVFEQVSFADIEGLRVRNRTTKTPAAHAIQNADGSFSALVPMRTGQNTLEVYARASDGSEATRQVRVRFLGEAGVQPLDARLLAQRNRLMENRLLELKRRSLEIESERDDAVRRDLNAEIAKEREEARKRAEEMRKELDLEVEE